MFTVIYAIIPSLKLGTKKQHQKIIRSGTQFIPNKAFFVIRKQYHIRLLLIEKCVALVEISIEHGARVINRSIL